MKTPYLPGRRLKDLRDGFSLTQQELAEVLEISRPTLQRLEKADRVIGDELARRLSHYLQSERDVWLELSLTPAALQLAEQCSLDFVETELGKIYWLPSVRKWAAEMRTRFPVSVDSQAADLASVLGLTFEQGVLVCDLCEEQNEYPPHAAFRECYLCHRFICGSSSCGDYVQLPNHDVREADPTACRHCLPLVVKQRGIPRGLHGSFLPGTGTSSSQLEDLYHQVRASAGERPSDMLSIQSKVEDAYRYFTQVKLVIENALADEIKPPPGVPDLMLGARMGLREAEGELRELQRLRKKIERDLSRFGVP